MFRCDLSALTPIAPLAETRSGRDLSTLVDDLLKKAGSAKAGRTIEAIQRAVDPAFIRHREHYERMVSGGPGFKGARGIRAVTMEAANGTAAITIDGSREWQNEAHTYRTTVQFSNYDRIRAYPGTTWTERARMLMRDRVRVHCTCEAFRYYHQHAATRKGFALIDEDTPAPVRNPRNRGGACKHLEHALRYLPANYNTIATAMKMHAVQESAPQPLPESFQKVAAQIKNRLGQATDELKRRAGRAVDRVAGYDASKRDSDKWVGRYHVAVIHPSPFEGSEGERIALAAKAHGALNVAGGVPSRGAAAIAASPKDRAWGKYLPVDHAGAAGTKHITHIGTDYDGNQHTDTTHHYEFSSATQAHKFVRTVAKLRAGKPEWDPANGAVHAGVLSVYDRLWRKPHPVSKIINAPLKESAVHIAEKLDRAVKNAAAGRPINESVVEDSPAPEAGRVSETIDQLIELAAKRGLARTVAQLRMAKSEAEVEGN